MGISIFFTLDIKFQLLSLLTVWWILALTKKDAELNPLTKQFGYSTLLWQHMVGDVVVAQPEAGQLQQPLLWEERRERVRRRARVEGGAGAAARTARRWWWHWHWKIRKHM